MVGLPSRNQKEKITTWTSKVPEMMAHLPVFWDKGRYVGYFGGPGMNCLPPMLPREHVSKPEVLETLERLSFLEVSPTLRIFFRIPDRARVPRGGTSVAPVPKCHGPDKAGKCRHAMKSKNEVLCRRFVNDMARQVELSQDVHLMVDPLRTHPVSIQGRKASKVVEVNYRRPVASGKATRCEEIQHNGFVARGRFVRVAGSCTANTLAVTSHYTFHSLQLQSGKDVASFVLIRFLCFGNERLVQGSMNKNAGAKTQDSIKVMCKADVWPDSLWKFRDEQQLENGYHFVPGSLTSVSTWKCMRTQPTAPKCLSNSATTLPRPMLRRSA